MGVAAVSANYDAGPGQLAVVFDGELTVSDAISTDGFSAVLPTGHHAVFSAAGVAANAGGVGTLTFVVQEGAFSEEDAVVTYDEPDDGAMGLALAHLRDMLAASAEFRAFVAAADAAAAKAKIYRDALPLPADNDVYSDEELAATYRPFALVWVDDQGAGLVRARTSAGPAPDFDQSGRLLLRLEQQVPADVVNDPGLCERAWRNQIGTIIDELCALGDVAGYLAFDRIEVTAGPARVTKGERVGSGDHQFVQIAVSWRG